MSNKLLLILSTFMKIIANEGNLSRWIWRTSILNLLEYVERQEFEDDTILYFLEDDYLHKPGWVSIMREGFDYLNNEYLTLYDHKDKYTLPMYSELQSRITITPSVHWRTTPSTTNTYAMLAKTFRYHIKIHKQFCDLRQGNTWDHFKFKKLWSIGSSLVSCVPGYSTHCDGVGLSPVINWQEIASNQMEIQTSGNQ